MITKDKIKLPKRKPALIVVKTDILTGPGKHLVVVFFPKYARVEFFDSLGKQPSYYLIQTSRRKLKINQTITGSRQ